MGYGPKSIKAEQSSILYLEMRGYKIIEQRYRRSKFTIDIIATKKQEAYFVSVIVLDEINGGALDLITAEKINNLRLAGALWIEEKEWQQPIHYSLIELNNQNYTVINYFEDYL